jgi:hypothetical protein
MGAMKLETYLREREISVASFAAKLGAIARVASCGVLRFRVQSHSPNSQPRQQIGCAET